MKRLAYTIAEFCEMSGLCRSNVYKAIESGQLRAKKLGRRTIILEEDAQEFLRNLAPA